MNYWQIVKQQQSAGNTKCLTNSWQINRVRTITKLEHSKIWLFIAILLQCTSNLIAYDLNPPINFFYESGAAFDIQDPLLDDKGPGYYQYPLDSRIPRGTYDLKRFTVYEEGNVVVFVIQMREYILTHLKGVNFGSEQDFVVQMFDIYIDMDRKANSGYQMALPARQITFKDNMGWEKMILVTPLSQFKVYDILKAKTDDLEFQKWIPDIIIPDYVQVQRDKIIVRINKEFLGKGNPSTWGYQLFVMGFNPVVSTNQFLNMDVRAFATPRAFGGGWDTYGDPPIMDCIVPEGESQEELLREYRSEPYRGKIENAILPFVYPNSESEINNRKKNENISLPSGPVKTEKNSEPVKLINDSEISKPLMIGKDKYDPEIVAPPKVAPPNLSFEVTPLEKTPPKIIISSETGTTKANSSKIKPSSSGNFIPINKSNQTVSNKQIDSAKTQGFVPLKKKTLQKN